MQPLLSCGVDIDVHVDGDNGGYGIGEDDDWGEYKLM
jgi:hypothetical protein